MPTRRLPVLCLAVPSVVDQTFAPRARFEDSSTRGLQSPTVGALTRPPPIRRLSGLKLGYALQGSLVTLGSCLSMP